MDDNDLIQLYLSRSELAISKTDQRYGNYCRYISNNILFSKLDAEECVNDTYLKLWQTIPPHIPQNFKAYLGSVCKNIALDRYKFNKAEKRNAQVEIALDELVDVLRANTIDLDDVITIKDCLNKFLKKLSKKNRIIFVRRYWYFDSVSDISKSLNISENAVKVSLHRIRNKLQKYLKTEGVIYD